MGKPVRKEGERLTFTISRDESGKFGVGMIQTRLGSAQVEYLQGAASESGLLQKYDRITHVNDEGPLDYKGVVGALTRGGKSVTVKIVRGEPPEPPATTASARSTAVIFLGMMTILAASSFVDFDTDQFMNAALAQQGAKVDGVAGSASAAAPAAPAGERSNAAMPPSQGQPKMRAGVKVGGQTFGILEDGAAESPDELRAAFRADKEMMRSLRASKPEWATVVDGFADGTYDVARFQQILRENMKAQKMSEASKLSEDGSAMNPEAYLKALKSSKAGRKWLKQIKEVSEELYDAVVGGDTEALQNYLRYVKQKDEAEANAPPPPATPYDDRENMKVHMSMRVMTDEGEEKDLYQVVPEETDEEKWHMPKEMRCTACQAVAYQAASAVADRLARRHNDELVGIVTLEALQDLCHDTDAWTKEYGIMPTNGGYNIFNGTGIDLPEGADFENMDVMMTSAHSGNAARKLADVCKALLLGADAPEEETFASMSLEAGSVAAAIERYKKELCQGHGQPCAAGAA